MILWVGFVVLGWSVGIGIYLGIEHVRGRSVRNTSAWVHGGLALSGVCLVLGHFSFYTPWNVHLVHEAIASFLLLAALFGLLIGLLRLAEEKLPNPLLLIHVVVGLLGVGLLGYYLWL